MTVVWDSDRIRAKAEGAAVEAVAAACQEILGVGNRLINSPPKTGIIYKRTHPRRTHQASAPGEAPAADLGGLTTSGRVIAPVIEAERVVGKVNWGTDYARRLEFGGEYVLPRPYARPALDIVAPSFIEGMQARVSAAFLGGGAAAAFQGGPG